MTTVPTTRSADADRTSPRDASAPGTLTPGAGTARLGNAGVGKKESGASRIGISGKDAAADPPATAAPRTASLSPLRTPPPEAGRTGGYLAVESRRSVRRAPSQAGLTRRRWLINGSKFLLPIGALLLLSSIALWPELDRAGDNARIILQGLRAVIDGSRVTNAHYNGVDERGRPYTVTATTATQRDEEQVDLTMPNADMTLENGGWINVKSKQGVYMRKAQQLDLSQDVVMYRDDGTTMTTDTATVEIKAGAASSAAPTHVEGPFGIIDATGFTTTDKGAAMQFWGPAHVVLNGVSQ